MKKVVLGALVLLIIGLVGTVATASFSDALSFNTVEVFEEKSVRGDSINTIDVNLSSTDVQFEPTNGDDIIVELNGRVSKKIKDQFKLKVNEKGDRLEVSLEKLDVMFYVGVTRIDLDLTLKLPEKIYDSIVIDASSADIEMRDLKLVEVKTNVSSGDVTFENLTTEQIELETSSGDVKLINSSADLFNLTASSGDIFMEELKGDITVVTNSGDISLKNNEVVGNMDFTATSGDVSVRFKNKPTSFSLDFKGTSGDGIVSLEGFNYSEKSEDRIIGKIGNASHELKVRTTSGDFSLD
jgi:lia operon protein LiaG